MRTLVIAAIAAAMAFGGTAANAQRISSSATTVEWNQPIPQPQPMPAPAPRPGAPYGQPRLNPQPLPPQAQPTPPVNSGQWNNGTQYNGQWRGGGYRSRSRWGGTVGGYWYAGVQAPGGWNGYRAIKRGKRIPSYWNSANFLIGDYNRYGLMAPPVGYAWTRYYNDALLIDRYGVVYDSRGGINWDAAAPVYAGAGYGYDDNTYSSAGAGYFGATTSDQSGSSSYRYDGSNATPVLPVAPARTDGTYYAAPATVASPGVTVTTTTTTYIEESYVAKRVYGAGAKKKWRPRPKPRCCPCGCR